MNDPAIRKVVTLFAPKWMIYDRYGTLLTGKQRPPPPNIEYVCGGIADSSPSDGPVPGTVWKGDVLDYHPDTLAWYEEQAEKREGLADAARAENGETEFELGKGLRATWLSAQQTDKLLLPMFAEKAQLAAGYRRAPDGLLERQVSLPPPANMSWVPIVPDGFATGHLSWKRWIFLQCHVGLIGAHRNADKTKVIIVRQVWWLSMTEDIKQWVEKCLTCLRFRRMAQKQEAQPVIPTDAECWEEVMMDLEGPSNPPDKQGNKYSMTYICCLCHGVLTERGLVCSAIEARRMFACCAMRSGTLPTLVRSDRGPELKNAVSAPRGDQWNKDLLRVSIMRPRRS